MKSKHTNFFLLKPYFHSMRYPAVAGKFYPADKSALKESISGCFRHELGPGEIGSSDDKRTIKGVLVPHAGYSCSGMNAAHAYRKIAEDGLPDAYVIIGPDHYGIPFDSALCDEPYLTPFGECDVDLRIIDKLSEDIPVVAEAHRFEHSIEVEVPFIQYIDPNAKIVPLIMSDQSIESAKRIGRLVREACKGMDVIVIASSDMSHYVPKPIASVNDHALIDRICSMDINGIYDVIRSGVTACGYGPISAMIEAISPANGKLLCYSDSYDALNYQKESVVGYASAIFY